MKNIVCLIFMVFSVLACSAAPQISKLTLEDFDFFDTSDMPLAEKYFFQTDIILPKSKNKYDSSILTNNFIPFKGYKGQGIIYMHCSNIKSFSLYLNGKKVDTTILCRENFGKINLKNLAKDGENFLYISDIQPKMQMPETKKNYFLNIKIPYPSIVTDEKKLENINYRALQICDDLMDEQIRNGFPSAQLVAIKNGKIIKNYAAGSVSTVDDSGYPLKQKKPVTPATLFDLASNTKMYAVNFAVQRLVSERKLSLNDKVSSFFPDFKDAKKAKRRGKETITIFDLLTHQAGFPAGGNFYANKKIRNKSKKDTRTNKEITLELILETNLAYTPGTASVYSDISYMLLGFIVEKVTGMPLDKYVEENIYKPLNLKSICYEPLKHGFLKDMIAATEIRGVKRTEDEAYKDEKYLPIQGTVHDAEAFFAMDGVSGHAGLFANAKSLAVLAQVMLNGGGYGTVKLFDSQIVPLFAGQAETVYQAGLGWRRQGAEKRYSWAFSPLSDSSSIGHSGWTGTLTLIDFKENLIVILLTSAKHTPVLHTKKRHGFEGDYYLAKGYGAFTTFIYAALQNYNNNVLDNMLIELIEGRYILLQESSDFDNEGFYKDLKAIMGTIKRQARTSKTLKKFLRSKRAKEINGILQSLRV